jgi:hypothetical protein
MAQVLGLLVRDDDGKEYLIPADCGQTPDLQERGPSGQWVSLKEKQEAKPTAEKLEKGLNNNAEIPRFNTTTAIKFLVLEGLSQFQQRFFQYARW